MAKILVVTCGVLVNLCGLLTQFMWVLSYSLVLAMALCLVCHKLRGPERELNKLEYVLCIQAWI